MSGKATGTKTVEVYEKDYERIVRLRAEIELKTGVRVPIRMVMNQIIEGQVL